MHLASSILTANMINDVIQKNGKAHLAVKTMSAKFDIGHLSTDLQSKELNPIILGLVNKAVNTQWRNFYGNIQSEIEDFICKMFQNIIGSVHAQMAIEDYFQ